jgi:hypothetical protein
MVRAALTVALRGVTAAALERADSHIAVLQHLQARSAAKSIRHHSSVLVYELR